MRARNKYQAKRAAVNFEMRLAGCNKGYQDRWEVSQDGPAVVVLSDSPDCLQKAEAVAEAFGPVFVFRAAGVLAVKF